MSLQDDLRRISELLHTRKLAEAEAVCRKLLGRVPDNPAVIHLFGLVRKDRGDLAEGERLLRHSIEIEPRNADYRLNLGNLLRRMNRLQQAEGAYRDALRVDPAHRGARLGLARTLNDLGQQRAAEQECRALLQSSSDDPTAWCALAMTLRDQRRTGEAEAAYRKALDIDPNHAAAHHNLGSLLATAERSEEALSALQHAQRLGAAGFELEFNLGRAYLQLYRIEDAEEAFARAVALDPFHIEAQSNLTRIRFMRGDPAFARDIEAAATANPGNSQLQLLLALVARRAGDFSGAETILRHELTRDPAAMDTLWALAETLLETHRLSEAQSFAQRAVQLQPDNLRACETLVSILLASEQALPALSIIRARRASQPLDQRWIAYEATAARLLGDPLYERLYDYERLVQTYDVQVPGWQSLESFNAELLRVLETKHRFTTHPLDQSLRHGSQTTRNLLTDPHPVLRAAFAAFARAVEEYRRVIGTDPSHPLTARNRGTTIMTAAWSVRLRGEGFHVNHIHPQGWISSAYYVEVPPESHDATSMQGWLKLGEPRFPSPRTTPGKYVEPRPGRLVLFPSYMWHGTRPIGDASVRTTIAFDVLTDAH